MNKIEEYIRSYYLTPEKLTYQILNKLNKHINKTVLLLGIVLFTFPTIQSVNLVQKTTKLENNEKEITGNLREKENILQTKLIEKGNSTTLTPTKINQQLEILFQQHQVEINHIQWELEQDKQINIALTQKAKNLFELIHQLNEIDYLRIKEITLTRLDYQNLVQLHATLQLVKQ